MKSFIIFVQILALSRAFTITTLPSVNRVSLVPRMAEETKTVSKSDSAVENSVETKLESAQITDEPEEELSETKKLMQQVKDAGVAGVISYAAWEIGFWTISVPVCIAGYRGVTGHWPDFSNQEDLQKLGAEAFAFVNFARFAVPLRIGLALGTTPWVQTNIVNRFMKKEGEDDETGEIKTEAGQDAK